MQIDKNHIIMMEPAPQEGDRPSFVQFIMRDRQNKKYLLVAIGAIILQFILFKYAYPFADFFTDAYTYIEAAANHEPVSFRQVGYSRFLWLFHFFTSSDTALVFFQYALMELAALYFFFTVLYFFRPVRIVEVILFILLFFDPAIPYLANYITSDALFAGVSILWITQLIWVVNNPGMYHILVQALLLLIAFNLRYAALFYPVITTLALLISPQNIVKKMTGIALSLLVVVGSVWYTTYKTWKTTGIPIFSAFSGWQLANNALHIYPYVHTDAAAMPAGEYRRLDSIVKRYFNKGAPARPANVTTLYMWDPDAPLKQYLRSHLKAHPAEGYFTGWNAVSPLFSSYGSDLIKDHPVAFIRYYLIPNAASYLLPHIECMYVYNEGKDGVDAMAVSWFKYRSGRVWSAPKSIQGRILAPFPALFLAGNILFIITCIWLFTGKVFKRAGPSFFASMLVLASFIAVNAAFSIFATMNILRYSIFPLIMVYAFSFLVLGVALRFYNDPQRVQ